MVLTVTLNPLLEKRLYFEKIELGKSFRSNKEELTAGGKGININRQLNLLGIKNSSFTFLGGNNGKLLRSILTHEQIEYSAVPTKSETRSADLVFENHNKRLTTFFGINSSISKEESDEFKHRLEKMIQNCSIVIFSGSSPCKETNDIFPYGIELANKFDKISVLDTYGEHHSKCIEAKPTIIHNNSNEIESSLGVSFQSEEEKIKFLENIYSKGIKLSFITDGEKPAYASKYDFHYKIYPPKIETFDPTGSGDAFVAGIVYGIENSLVFDDFLKIAAGLGTANASMWSTCRVTVEQMNLYNEKVKFEPIGKKMKLIDDSPTIY